IFFILLENILINYMTKVNNFNPIIYEKQNNVYKSHLLKARIYKVASIINLFAICILTSSMLIAITSATSSLAAGFLLVGFTIPFFGVFYNNFNIKANKHFQKANLYKKVISELNELKKKPKSEIEKILKKLRVKNISLEHSLPILAHFNAWEKIKIDSLEAIENLKKIDSDELEVSEEIQKQVHNIYEKEILFSKLKQAECINILNHIEDKRKVEDVCTIINYGFSKRTTSILNNKDIYLIFKKKIKDEKENRKISFSEIDSSNVHDISKLIFIH
ncbi:MAG: hypothetical protein JXA94_07330, partial [Parachlamydiales bacterium]|nr:hypothetical protein [Parachlamydiales bacterium]